MTYRDRAVFRVLDDLQKSLGRIVKEKKGEFVTTKEQNHYSLMFTIIKRRNILKNKPSKTEKLNDSFIVNIRFPKSRRPFDRIGMRFSQATFITSTDKKSQMLCE